MWFRHLFLLAIALSSVNILVGAGAASNKEKKVDATTPSKKKEKKKSDLAEQQPLIQKKGITVTLKAFDKVTTPKFVDIKAGDNTLDYHPDGFPFSKANAKHQPKAGREKGKRKRKGKATANYDNKETQRSLDNNNCAETKCQEVQAEATKHVLFDDADEYDRLHGGMPEHFNEDQDTQNPLNPVTSSYRNTCETSSSDKKEIKEHNEEKHSKKWKLRKPWSGKKKTKIRALVLREIELIKNEEILRNYSIKYNAGVGPSLTQSYRPKLMMHDPHENEVRPKMKRSISPTISLTDRQKMAENKIKAYEYFIKDE